MLEIHAHNITRGTNMSKEYNTAATQLLKDAIYSQEWRGDSDGMGSQ